MKTGLRVNTDDDVFMTHLTKMWYAFYQFILFKLKFCSPTLNSKQLDLGGGIIADNNAINRKTVSKFSTPPDMKIKYIHPVQFSTNRPLYYFVDTFYLLKCIRNHWFNQKEQILCFPDFSDTLKGGLSSVRALKELHLIQKDELLQYGSSLTLKSLYP